MGLLQRMRRMDDAVLGGAPATPAGRLDWLRRFAARGVGTGVGSGITAVAVVDLADRLEAVERRLAELEAQRR